MNLVKGDLRIRPATDEDAQRLCDWWNDGKIMAHAGFPNGLGTNAAQVLESLKKDTDDNRRLIIESGCVPIGEMSYRTIHAGVAEIGIKICISSEREKGMGTEFIRMLLRYLFVERGYEKVVLDTNLQNTRAQHVYEKIGFTRVGTNIDSWKNQLGELQSSVDYELTRESYLRLSGVDDMVSPA